MFSVVYGELKMKSAALKKIMFSSKSNCSRKISLCFDYLLSAC